MDENACFVGQRRSRGHCIGSKKQILCAGPMYLYSRVAGFVTVCNRFHHYISDFLYESANFVLDMN